MIAASGLGAGLEVGAGAADEGMAARREVSRRNRAVGVAGLRIELLEGPCPAGLHEQIVGVRSALHSIPGFRRAAVIDGARGDHSILRDVARAQRPLVGHGVDPHAPLLPGGALWPAARPRAVVASAVIEPV